MNFFLVRVEAHGAPDHGKTGQRTASELVFPGYYWARRRDGYG
jgi:hypothetical protein